MKIDVHNHVGFDPEYEIERKASDLLKEMENSEINKSIIFPFTTNPDILGQNELISKAINKNKENFIGFFSMNPKLDEMTSLIEDYKNKGFKGIVTDPRFGVDHSEKLFHELVECANLHELIVWLHSDDKDTMRVYIQPLETMLNKYPSTMFILSSMYYDAVGIATRHKNVFLDTSTAMSGSMTAAWTQPIGTHRILMGSNSPYNSLKREIEKLEFAPELTAFQKSLIFYENARRLINL
ncbi:MAG: amidohydrolase family protein [Candidatus Thorarchaeota archaeon]